VGEANTFCVNGPKKKKREKIDVEKHIFMPAQFRIYERCRAYTKMECLCVLCIHIYLLLSAYIGDI